MPLPRLLKKLSRKNLSKSQSPTSSVEDPPPLPTRKSSASDASYGYVVTSLPNHDSPSPPADSCVEKPSAAGSKAPSGEASPSPPLAAEEDAVPEDDLSKDLRGAWASATTAPKVGKADKVLLQLENGVAGAMEKQAQGAAIMEGVKTGLDAVGGMEAIEKGLNSFMEGMPVLMKALDEVADIHPFIKVAVLAFKAVWALEQKRRENDRRILTLHMEMKDMMGVLIQLKNVKDAREKAPDGTTIEGRMQEIAKGTADDIKDCANACDTYSKKKLIVKVLKGPIWEGRLVEFVKVFSKRREQFEFALSIHTARGVDAANKAIGTVDKTTQEMNAKMDMMMKMFAQMVSPEQKEMARLVEQRGGQAVLDNDKALKELNDLENKSGASQGTGKTHGGNIAKLSDLDDLKDDLHMDPDAAMEQNMTVFTRKFEVQKRQIIDELSRVVERQGDRIISAVNAGPHDRIIDPASDIHRIWKEMGWRGSVKTRHFVMALRDYFQEENSKSADGEPHEHPTTVIDKADVWALEYINVIRLQAISEAFDDDASGFVTVAEVNAFTTARPLDWSLPRWIAYWAIGQHQASKVYVDKICDILSKMFAIMPKIRQVNKSSVNAYLRTIYRGLYTFVASLNSCYINDALYAKFTSYIESEEARIRRNLEAVQYDIDAADTLRLVTGEGRIERYALPVMYLLLERHFEIFRVCQTLAVSPDELWDAGDTLLYVFDPLYDRLATLQSIFKQQKLDLAQQFKGFSFGLYEYMNTPNLLWDAKLVQEAKFEEYTYDDSKEAQDIDVAKILNHPLDEEPLDFDAYALPQAPQPINNTLPPVAGVLGLWHGHIYFPETAPLPIEGMSSMDLQPCATGQSDGNGTLQVFTAASRANVSDFKITGEARTGTTPGTVTISFKCSFPARFPAQYYVGTWDAATETLSGKFSSEEEPGDPEQAGGAFVFRRIAPEYMCFAPAPVELEANKSLALWAFAIDSVRFDIRRKGRSWSYFKERRDNRKRFIELYIRSTKFGPSMSDEEWEDLSRVKKTLTTSDSRFYHSLAEAQIRATTDHNAYCDNCRGRIGGARISCLVCQMKDTFNTVDFCSTPGCLTQRVMRDDMQKAHLPHHDLMKVRRVVHTRQFGKTYRDAKEALKHAQTLFKPAQSGVSTEPEANRGGENEKGEEGHAPVEVQAKRMSGIPALAVSIPDSSPGVSISTLSAGGLFRCTQLPPSRLRPRRGSAASYACAGSTFICWECDAKSEERAVAFPSGHDFHTHDLVRVQELVEDRDFSVEERLGELEERFGRMEQLLEQLLSRLAQGTA
ncbi:hypothetical protein DFH08DRAFT_941029 [Mycena albidolilacea]|uniref:Vacuolar protein sorting-associated protein 13 second N-terminal domain-containing protein n=1 Tax=Mycena albidolilacea TaxID=1033008 RepID=A0AAD6ZL17_9AGAR|nr:hypothetical protein DFH08DRAFT_941029 [Mycena albidolilacea]